MKQENLFQRRLKSTLEELYEVKRISEIDSDKIMREFPWIISLKHVQNKLPKFKRSKDSLDSFLFEIWSRRGLKRYYSIFKIDFHIFSWKTSVERGFSANKDFEVENLAEKSLFAQRSVYNAIQSAGEKNVIIEGGMMKAFRNLPPEIHIEQQIKRVG